MFPLAPASRSDTTFSPVWVPPKATTTSASSPSPTPSSINPINPRPFRSRSLSFPMFAAVALIQCLGAAPLPVTSSFAQFWLRVLIPAASSLTTRATLFAGSRMA